MKRIRNISLVLVLCVLAVAVQAQAAVNYDVPVWAGTGADGTQDGNPYSDGTNAWTLYSIDESGTSWNDTSVIADFANYVPMVWRDGWQFWQGQPNTNGHPSYSFSASTAAANKPELRSITTATNDYVGALAMTAGATGDYSLSGNLLLSDPAAGNHYVQVKIGTFDASNTYTLIKTLSGYLENATIALGSVTELQDMALTAGDKLVITSHAQEGNTAQCLADLSDVSVGVVPEPTTLGLLAVGSLSILRRRRRQTA